MTTAHRPTWNAAKGEASGLSQGGYMTGGAVSHQISVQMLPGHKKMKEREPGQSAVEEVQQRDLKGELEARERRAMERRRREAAGLPQLADHEPEKSTAMKALLDGKGPSDPSNRELLQAGLTEEEQRRLAEFDDADRDIESDGNSEGSNEFERDDDDDDDDDDEEEEEELMRELERLRAEREEKKRREEAEEAELQRKEAEAAAVHNNPLLRPSGRSMVVKRRWDEDVIFKNQARDEPPSKRKRFINDTLRNDFHRKFIQKYVQ